VVKKSEQRRGRAEEGVRTRARMVDAALQTLIDDGYSGTSARTIAARAQLNPALVFYHYGGVDELLLAALDKSSAERLDRYREAISRARTPDELVRDAAELFREDIEGGHVTAVTEMIGASLSKPQLRTELVKRMRPWLELTQAVLERILSNSPLAPFATVAGPAAFAVVSGYLGLNMLSRLMPDPSQTEALFQLLEQLTQLAPSQHSVSRDAAPAR
jgi:AcrR family transcriptional regulator